MADFVFPDPILDKREENLLVALTKDYEKFTTPGVLSWFGSKITKGVVAVTPERLNKIVRNAVDKATELEFIKKTLDHAGRGFLELTKYSSRVTLSPDTVVKLLNKSGCSCSRFEHICAVRSYDIEKVVSRRIYADLLAAFVEGGVTGFPGIFGLPFNFVLSFFLYFRAVQSIALFYGYNVKEDPRELEFASEVTIKCLAGTIEASAETTSGLIGKMMLAAEVTELKNALARSTYTEMAKEGGAKLLYVQIRALAHHSAQNALHKAGQEGLESNIFMTMLKQIGENLSQQAGRKIIPFVGAGIGALSDTYYMSRIVKGSNMIYHKRFLFEKEQRLECLH